MQKILNLGCGNDMYGTHRVDVIKTDATTLVCDIEKGLPFEDNYFDKVYGRNIFEHLADPNKMLVEAKRILKKGGIIFMETDNAGLIYNHYNLMKKSHGNMIHNGKDNHYALYQPEHLRNHFEKVGLTVLKYEYKRNPRHSIIGKIIHFIIKNFLPKKFGYEKVIIEGKKK